MDPGRLRHRQFAVHNDGGGGAGRVWWRRPGRQGYALAGLLLQLARLLRNLRAGDGQTDPLGRASPGR